MNASVDIVEAFCRQKDRSAGNERQINTTAGFCFFYCFPKPSAEFVLTTAHRRCIVMSNSATLCRPSSAASRGKASNHTPDPNTEEQLTSDHSILYT